MWIFYSNSGDPMLLDSCAGLRELHTRIEAFLESIDQTLTLSAAADGDPAPCSQASLRSLARAAHRER